MSLRRLFLSLFAILFMALPLSGFAEQMPACGHCQPLQEHEMKGGTCHQHHAMEMPIKKSPEKCGQCVNCAGCAHIIAMAPGLSMPTAGSMRIDTGGYRPAHFYRLSEQPLDRPPSLLPA